MSWHLRNRRPGLIGLIASALIASSAIVVAPFAAHAATATPDVPRAPKAIATANGTEVRFQSPANVQVKPTGYQVISCGPYAADALTLARMSACASAGKAITTTTVNANTYIINSPCKSTTTDLCVVVLRSVAGKLVSKPTTLTAGGVAPAPVESLQGLPLTDGRSVSLTWKIAEQPVQFDGSKLTPTYEVYRGATLIAENIVGSNFTDGACGVATKCSYRIAAVTPAGRVHSASITTVTSGTAAPTLTAPAAGFISPKSTISGKTGHGTTDARDVFVSFTRQGADSGGPTIVQGIRKSSAFSVTVPSLIPGYYTVVASQSGRQSKAIVLAIAPVTNLTFAIAGATGSPIPMTPSLQTHITGTALAGPVGKVVTVEDRALATSIKFSKAPSATDLAKLFNAAPTGQRANVFGDVIGLWTATFNVAATRDRFHIVAVTQTSFAGKLQTLYSVYRAPKAGAPSAPRNGLVTTAPNSLTVSWTAPADTGGSDITGYKVTTSPASAGCVVTETGCVIAGLTNGVAYTISVVALNAVGESTVLTIGPAIPVAVPSAPTHVSTTVGDGQVTVTWQAPDSDGGSPVIGYQVVAEPTGRTCSTKATDSQPTKCVFSELTNGTAYTFTIVATNASGNSAASTVTDKPIGAPSEPLLLTAVPGDRTVTLTWSASVSDGGLAIKTYTATAQPGGKTCTTDASGRGCTITGLTNDTDYTVTLVATNNFGNSGASNALPARPRYVEIHVPSAPQAVTATAQQGSLVVNWNAPTDLGGGVSNYRATASPRGQFCTSTAGTSCTISGLDDFAIYTVRVVATNSAGTSTAAKSAKSSFCALAPYGNGCYSGWAQYATPINVTAIHSDQGVDISFDGNQGPYSNVSYYLVTAAPSGATCMAYSYGGGWGPPARSSCRITTAVDAAETFRVTAVGMGSSSAPSVPVTAAALASVTLDIPPAVRANSLTLTGSAGGVAKFWAILMPKSCASVYNCADEIYYAGVIDGDENASVTIEGAAEGDYLVYLTWFTTNDPLNSHMSQSGTPMTIDRTAPTAPQFSGGNVSQTILTGTVDYEAVLTVGLNYFVANNTSTIPDGTIQCTLASDGTFSCNLSTLEQGSYRFIVVATDLAGNNTSTEQQVNLDTIAPTVIVTQPTTGATGAEGVVVVSGEAPSATGDGTVVFISARSGNLIANATAKISQGRFTANLTLAAGIWTITVTRFDSSGNRTVITRILTVEPQLGDVSITLPGVSDTVPTNCKVVGRAPASTTVVVSVDGVDQVTTTSDSHGVWRASLVLSLGSREIVARTVTESATTVVTADSNAPTLTIATMGPGSRTASNSVCGTATTNASVIVSWGLGTATVAADAEGIWCAPITDLADGTYTFLATSGVQTSSRDIVIDRTAPALTVVTPNGSWTNSRLISVTSESAIGDSGVMNFAIFAGTDSSEDAYATFTARVDNNRIAAALPAEVFEGTWTLVVTRADASGNVGRREFRLDFDATAPSLLSNIADTMAGPLTIRGTAGIDEGDVKPTLTIDDVAYALTVATDGSFTITTEIVQGTHSITLSQSDAAGNVQTTTTEVVVDSVAPQLAWQLVDGATLTELLITGNADGDDGDIAITATPEKNNAATLTTRVQPDGGSFLAELGETLDAQQLGGWWNVTATRSDAAGNTTSLRVRIFIDPTATFLSLSDTVSISAQRNVTIAGIADSASWLDGKVNIKVVGSAGTAYSGSVAIVDGRFTLNLVLNEGVYEITASRVAPIYPVFVTTTLQVDTTAPVIVVEGPQSTQNMLCGTTAQNFGDEASVVVTFSQAGTDSRISVAVQNGKFCTTPPASGTWSALVEQSDGAGHLTHLTVAQRNYDLDAPQPTVVETSPPLPPNNREYSQWGYGIPQWHGFLSGTASTGDGDGDTVSVHLTRSQCDSDCSITLIGNVKPDGTWSISLTPVDEGDWYVDWVKQTDDAGNVGQFTSAAADRFWLIVDHASATAPILTRDSLTTCFSDKRHAYTAVMYAYRGEQTVTPFATVRYTDQIGYSGGGNLRSPGFCLKDWQTYPFVNRTSGAFYVDSHGDERRLPNGIYTLVAVVLDETGAATKSTPLKITVDSVAPVLTVAGFTSDDSNTAAATASVTAHPVLHGSATYDDVTNRFVTLTVDPAETTQDFTFTVPVSSDGAWEWKVPSYFWSGSFRVQISQGMTTGRTSNMWYDFILTSPVATITSAVMQRRFTLSNGVAYNSIMLSGTLPTGRIAVPSIYITSPWLADNGSDSACRDWVITTTTWSCNFTGPTEFSGWGANSGYRDATYTFVLKMGYWVSSSYNNADPSTWIYNESYQVATDSTLTIALKTSIPAPVIKSPTAPQASQPVPTMKGDLTITGRASRATGDDAYVTAEIYNGREVSSQPAQTRRVDVNSDGEFASTFALTDGTWTVRVCQSDSQGATGCSDSTTRVIDNTAPTLTIAWPATTGSRMPFGYAGGTLSGGYGDSSGYWAQFNSDFSVATVEFFAGTDLTNPPAAQARVEVRPLSPTRDSWGTRQELASGQWTVRVTATDGVGNTSIIIRTFIVDDNATADLVPTFTVLDSTGARVHDGSRLVAGNNKLVVVTNRATPPLAQAFELLAGTTVVGSGTFDINGFANVNATLSRRTSQVDLSIRYAGDSLYRATQSTIGQVTIGGNPPTVTLYASHQYGGGRGGFVRVLAQYQDANTGWETCTTGLATIYDADGRLLVSDSLIHLSSGVAIGATRQGTRTVSVQLSGDKYCDTGITEATFAVKPSTTGQATASASFNPAPYVGQQLPITITVAGGGWNRDFGWLGVPVWLLDDSGNKIDGPFFTTQRDTTEILWTPNRAGNITLSFLAGGAGTGFAETRTTLTVPVEQSNVELAWNFNPASTHPGEQTLSTLAIGGAGNLGSVSISSSIAPSTKTSATINCAATCAASTNLPAALLDAGTGQIIGTFTSAATGRNFTVSTTVPRTAWPVVATLTSTSDSQVNRDTLVPVTASVTFPTGMPSRLRTGKVVLSARPSASCAQSAWAPTDYCTQRRFEVTVDIATLTGSVTRSIAGRTATIAAQWAGNTLVIDSQLFVGGTDFDLAATFVPTDSAVSSSASAGLARKGTGGAAITVQVASALISGGLFAPPQMPEKQRPEQRLRSWTQWNERDPRVGEAVFVRVQFDPELATPTDYQTNFALALSEPGNDPIPVDGMLRDHMIQRRAVDRGSWSLASWDSIMKKNPDAYTQNRNLPSCTGCLVWDVRDLDNEGDRAASGGLTIGDRTLGVMSYVDGVRTGITGFHLSVEPVTGTEKSTASIDGSALTVITAARWNNLIAETPTEEASIKVTVRLNGADLDSSTDLAECFYAGFCLDTDVTGAKYVNPQVMPLGGQLGLTIPLTDAQVAKIRAGATITVLTEAPWGMVIESPPLAVRSKSIASQGTAQVSVSGTWLGARAETPDISSPWGLLGWGFYESTKVFFESAFGKGGVADFFISLTGILTQMVVEFLFQGGPFGPLSALSGVIKAVTSASKAALMGTKIAQKVITKGGTVVTTTQSTVARWARTLVSKFVTVGADVNAKPGRLAILLKKVQGVVQEHITTAMWHSCKATSVIRDATVPVSLQSDDPLFKSSNCVRLAYEAATLDVSDDPSVIALDAYQQAMASRVARLQKDNPPPVTDVGYGKGVAMQFTHSFSAIVRLSVPGYDSMSDADKAKGSVTIDAYDSLAPSGNLLGNLAQCSFAGVCTAVDGLSASPGANAIVLAGVFPHKYSWTPAGALLRVTVRMPDGSTTYSGLGGIPFAGERYNCWSAWEKAGKPPMADMVCKDQDAAERFYTVWRSSGIRAWPAEFKAEFDYPRDTPLLSGPLP